MSNVKSNACKFFNLRNYAFKMYLSLVLLIKLTLVNYGDSAKILFFLGVSTYSHRILISPLAEKLAERGDQVTFFCPLPPRKGNKNITEFLPHVFKNIGSEISNIDYLNPRLKNGQTGNMWSATELPGLGLRMCETFVSAPETQELLKNSTFDLVIIDSLFNECAFGLAYKFQAKTIIFATSTVLSWMYDTFGFLPETSWVNSEIFMSFSYPFNIGERMINTIAPLLLTAFRHFYYYPALAKILKTQLKIPEMPPLTDLLASTSLILLNTHFSEEEARSVPPFIIPIGGLHLEDPKKNVLPKDILDFIKGAGKEGFIYVSFGSGARISDAPAEFRNILYTAFQNSGMKFIWKLEGLRPAEIPASVFTSEWLPQQQILALKPRAFITHAGVLSIQEATAFQIPVIAFPIFGDQDYTAFRVARTGRGIKLELSTLTVETFASAITEILDNTTYKENMVKAGILFNDRPRSPMDESIWWVDYVLRRSNTDHLKPMLGMERYWFERRALEVWFFISLLIGCLLVFFLHLIARLSYLILRIFRKFGMRAKIFKSKTE